MIRVAGLHDQVEAGITDKRRAGLNPSETIDALRATLQPQFDRQARLSTTCCGPRWPNTGSASSRSTTSPTTSAGARGALQAARCSRC